MGTSHIGSWNIWTESRTAQRELISVRVDPDLLAALREQTPEGRMSHHLRQAIALWLAATPEERRAARFTFDD